MLSVPLTNNKIKWSTAIMKTTTLGNLYNYIDTVTFVASFTNGVFSMIQNIIH